MGGGFYANINCVNGAKKIISLSYLFNYNSEKIMYQNNKKQQHLRLKLERKIHEILKENIFVKSRLAIQW